MASIAVGSRLGFRVATFMLVLEIITFFGNATKVGRILDAVAMASTISVIVLSTFGMRVLLSWMQRLAQKDETL